MRKLLFVLALAIPVIAMLPVAAAYSAANLPIMSGGWDDGTTIEWVCKPGTDGAVAFRLTFPDGTIKRGELKCGEDV
jgi:hypothetical protein